MNATALGSANQVAFRDGEIAVFELGNGPVVGYLHGMLGNPGVHPFLEALAGEHRVVAPSLPGFMPSAPRDDLRFLYDWVVTLSEVVDLAGLAGAPVVASSVGAMLALELAAVRPDAFERLVLLSPLGLWDDDHPVADLFATPSFGQRELLLEDPARASTFFEEDLSAAREAALEHGIARYHTRRAAASLIWPIPDHGLADRIHRVTVPVGLVWGERDRFNPVDGAGRYAGALSGHLGTRTVADAGHCLEWDAPAEAAAAVEELLG
jgi:pimeloyl-ACP methyl ester carboxylesterase